MDGPTFALWLGISVTIGGGVVYSVKWLHKEIYLRATNYLDSSEFERQENKKARSEISDIKIQLFPNHGGSLKDQLNAIEKDVVMTRIGQALITNSLGMGTFTTNEDGECITVGLRLCEIMGQPETEILGNNWKTHIHPEDADDVWKEWSAAIENKTNFEKVYRFIRSDKEIQLVKVTASAIKKERKFVGMSGVVTYGGDNIAERLKAIENKIVEDDKSREAFFNTYELTPKIKPQ